MNIPETTVLDDEWRERRQRACNHFFNGDWTWIAAWDFCAYLYALDGQRRESRSEVYEDGRHK